jgi:hypothetical protein
VGPLLQPPIALQRDQVLGAAGLELAARDRLDAGPHDLRGIGAEVHDHAQERGLARGQPDAQRGQAEVDQQELDQEGRVPDRLDVGLDHRAQRPRARALGPRARDADEQAEDHRRGRQAHGEPRPAQELVDVPPDDAELEDVVHAGGAVRPGPPSAP